MSFKLGLIGYPIQHSLSPWIHAQFLERTEQKGTYEIMEIDTNASFPEAMDKLKNSQIDGFNVTVPYKEKIIPYLDHIDEQAKKIGAVNTVKCENGVWTGYNTDGAGYVRSLLSKYPQLAEEKSAKILLLGAGGAAKGIYHALVAAGYEHIVIANRTVEKAQDIVKEDKNSKVATLNEVAEDLAEFRVIIQTTSVGMKPEVDQSIITLNHLHDDAIVSDIVYQPLETKILTDAKNLNADIHFGHTMLLYQAQYAFEIWTGKSPNMEGLDEALQNILEG
ncbi:MAG TPA: shikimate dehydrogenase [Pseudogracilibacillus sp.]|nr:shikimate dehydrogenase [Pseudogracilibacillus sp.]